MGKSNGVRFTFSQTEEGHRIVMPEAGLTYTERVAKIPQLVQGWFNSFFKRDDVPGEMATGAPFEVRILEVEALDAFSLGSLLGAYEQASLQFDDGDKFGFANASHLIEVFVQHGKISEGDSSPTILALGTVNVGGGEISVPTAAYCKTGSTQHVQLSSCEYLLSGNIWSPGDAPLTILVVRDAPILDQTICCGCG